MKKILDLITDEVTKAFTECGYDAKYAKVTLSNYRTDLIFVNTSVTAPWQPPRNTKKPHL